MSAYLHRAVAVSSYFPKSPGSEHANGDICIPHHFSWITSHTAQNFRTGSHNCLSCVYTTTYKLDLVLFPCYSFFILQIGAYGLGTSSVVEHLHDMQMTPGLAPDL